tara:strand:- start:159 stop:335 length:177 start_codon:yes stop_codon:yes gene_type:complete
MNHQEIFINLDLFVAIPAKTKDEAFVLLDRLSKKEVLLLALAQLPFDETDAPMPVSIN